MRVRCACAVWLTIAVAAAGAPQPAAGQGGRGQGGRGRFQQQAAQQGTAVIAGRILTADTGRPLKHARVMASSGGRGGRGTTTDEQGRFQLTDLPAGSYTVTASRNGFVDAIYGQHRPLQPGTPIELSDGQQVTGIDLRLIRGGVITGRLLDEDGEPLARALVSVQRYQYVRGERQLVAAGADQTDDRGVYRVFGLPPGTYFVSANAASLAQLLGRGVAGLAAMLGAGGRGRGLGAAMVDDPEPVGYAPTYYPGVVSTAEAGKITVGPGQEVGGIDFQAQLVPLVTVQGIVIGATDPAIVALVPSDSAMPGALALRTMSQQDGTFTIHGVPPGRYTAIAQSGGFMQAARVGRAAVIVNGQNVAGLALALQPGVTFSGNITVESSGTPAPTDYSSFRVEMPDVDPLPGAGGRGGRGGNPAVTRAEKNGEFTVTDVMPGPHYIRVTGSGNWTLKSITINGQDVTDAPVDFEANQNVGGGLVVFTDRTTALSGTVHDGSGAVLGGLTVIAFSSDPQYWRAQSRFIRTARTDQSGAYTIRGLPPGNYHLIALDDVDTGEWFDPSFLAQIAPAAKDVSLNEGETKTVTLERSTS